MVANALGRLFRGRRTEPPLAPVEAYELWADCYPPHPHNPLMATEQAIVAPIIRAARPRVALDVGTGTGRNLRLLRAAGARAVGIDLSRAMLARHRPGSQRVCGNACALPFANGRFDFVCSSLMAGDLDDLGAWVREAARVLAGGGELVYSDFHPDWAKQGWRRTFTSADGEHHELSYVTHPIEQHLVHLEAAGLEVRHVREPRVPGMTAHAVVIFHLRKRSRRDR